MHPTKSKEIAHASSMMLQETMDFVQVEKPLVSLQNISDNVEFFIFRMAPNL
ncbi:hypothetical protein Avbf_08026, partial [Armadillidium vulgare]